MASHLMTLTCMHARPGATCENFPGWTSNGRHAMYRNRGGWYRPALALACYLLTAPAVLLGGCSSAAERPDPDSGNQPPDYVVAIDGFPIPLRHWPASGTPERIALGVHGFGDYGGGFEDLAKALNRQGVSFYAHDQRGFGTNPEPGIWPGAEVLAGDVRDVAGSLRQRHPDLPLYLVGKSMGGAVTILAMTSGQPPDVDGVVLIAPAVWSRDTMPWYQRLGLELGTQVAPGLEFSAELALSLGIEPTDEQVVIDTLREDPLVQRSARVDTMEGLTELMGDAQSAVAQLSGPVLLLYGERDEIIPAEPVCLMFRKLPDDPDSRLRYALYPEGYHMLTRYSRADRTHSDIAAWLRDADAPLPSGNETTREAAITRLCDQ